MKKKFLALLLAVLMVVSLLPTVAFAAVTKPEGANWLIEYQVWYQLTDTDSDAVKDTLIIGGEGAMLDWSDAYGDAPFNQNAPWWEDTETFISFEHLIVQEGITTIGGYAFSDINTLKDVSLPSTLTAIGEGAFAHCSALTAVALPSGLTDIGEYAFNFSGITSIDIPEGVTKISACTFQRCEYLQSLSLPSGLKTIDANAFAYIGKKLGENVTIDLTLPNGLQSIGRNAFSDSRIKALNIPDSVEEIGQYAFNNCGLLQSVTLPENSNFSCIKNNTFSYCTSLTAIDIPANITEISESAFSYSRLTKITIPKTVTTMGDGVFEGCEALTEVTFEEGRTAIGNADDQTGLFSGCSALTAVNIPEGVLSIGSSAFWGCSSLTNIVLPNSLTTISDFAFSNCSQDDGSGLSEIHIPKNVTAIGERAFSGSVALQTVVVHSATPATTFGSDVFESTHENLKIYVPSASVEDYKGADGWITYEDKIVGAYVVDTEIQGQGKVTASPAYVEATGYTPDSQDVTLTVTPAEGWLFKEGSLKVNGGTITLNGNTFKMPDSNVTVTAEFEEIPTYGIISEVQGHGSVTTKIGDADVAKAVAGASVEFTATADEGYQFKEWVDVRSNANISGHTTDSTLTVTMPAAEIKIKAVFEKAAPTVTIETNGHGTVVVNIGEDTTEITDSTFTVPAGSKVTLKALADEGYHLNEWVDMRSNVTIENGNTFIMPDKDVKIKAVYSDTLRADYLSIIEGYYDRDITTPRISMLINSDGVTTLMNGGRSLQTWDELDIVVEELFVPSGAEEVMGVPEEGSYATYSVVTTKTGDSNGQKMMCYLLQDGKCQKVFHPAAGFFTRTAQPFNIIVEDDGHGTAEALIDSTKVESAAAGADVNLVITSTNEGYAFKEWQIARGLASDAISAENKFTMPGNEVKVKAIFERVYNINMQDDGHGTATAKIGDSVVTAAASGNGITLVPQAAEGYELDQWEIVSGDFSITGNGFTMPESNVTIKATFKVKEVCDCEYTKTVKLSEGTFGMKLGGKDMGWFKFEAVDGGWKILKTAKPGLLGTILNPYLAMKDGKLTYTDSDNATIWTYKNGAFYTSVKTTKEVKTSYGILGWLFGFGGKTTKKDVTTTYYLSTVTDGQKLSTNTVKAELYTEASGAHEYGNWIDCKDGNHKRICKNCGEVETDVHHYGADDKCKQCGAFDSTKANVKISVVDVKTKTTKQYSGFLFWGTWKNVTTYTATIKTEATGVKVTKVQYQVNGGKWMTGTCVSSDKPIDSLKVKVTDNKGKTYNYEYPEAPAADFTVTFNMNGHGDPISSITNVTSGATIDEPNDPTADGYVFKGWFKEEACENEWNFGSDTVTKDTTLYAKWNITLGGLMASQSNFPTARDGGWEISGENDLQMYYADGALKTETENAFRWVESSAELTSVADGYQYTGSNETPGNYTVTFVVSGTQITSIIISLTNDDNEAGLKAGTYEPAHTCFVAGTQVQYDLAGNTKNIEDFKVGDDIVSYNVNTGEYYLAKVKRLFIHDGAQQTAQLVDMTLENGTVITMTANHPIFTQDGFKSVSGTSTLTAEDNVFVGGEWIDISDIQVYSCEPTTTYNIDVIDLDEIEDDNTLDTYIAGGAVVHNKPE